MAVAINMQIPFIRYRRIFYLISGILVVGSIMSVVVFGLRLGIDFTGGSVLEVEYKEKMPSLGEIRAALGSLLPSFTLQQRGERGVVLKTVVFEEKTYQDVLTKLGTLGEIKEGTETFESIGPMIGRELTRKTKIVVGLALSAILLYIAFSFRRISRPVKSWVYGLTSLVALFHDVLIPLGVFVVLGRFYGVEITISIITAFLTVFGYSINDTVVVFDRVRENLLKGESADFNLVVEKSLNQSLTRSVNTSFTTLLALFSIFVFGGVTLKYFALALILGIGLGTYSSLFLATPLLVSYLRFKERKYRR